MATRTREQEHRRDNVRLIRRIRDTVGHGAPPLHDPSVMRAFSPPRSGASGLSDFGKLAMEEVGDGCYLEEVDPTLQGTCLCTVVVEVSGLKDGESVWMCGDDKALGAGREGKGLKLTLSPHMRLKGEDGAGETQVFSAIVRLAAGKPTAYKYFVSPDGAGLTTASSELGESRQFVTPSHGRGAVFDCFRSPFALLAERLEGAVPAELPSTVGISGHKSGSAALDNPEESVALERPLRTASPPPYEEIESSESAHDIEPPSVPDVEHAPAFPPKERARPAVERHGTPDWVQNLGTPQMSKMRVPSTPPPYEAPEDVTGAKLDFVVEMHGLAADDSVYLCGSDDALGAWNKAKSLLLTRIAPDTASCALWRCQVYKPIP